MKFSKRTIFIILVVIITIAVDQISKGLIGKFMKLGEVIPIFDSYFMLNYVKNEGAFLGMGSELNKGLKIILLHILPLVVLAFVLRHILIDKSIDKLSLFAFSSIIGGGIANVFDRVVYGKVTDFFYIWINDFFHTGIFNMADLSVTTGLIILVMTSFRKENKIFG
jgi:signal peptidase II